MPDGLVYDRPSFTWVTPEEMARRTAIREERIFRRKASQGQLCAPMIISDGIGRGVQGLQSQADGRFYDSKSALRRHYREAGVVEIGNDVPKERVSGGGWQEPNKDRNQMDAIGRAFNRVGLPTT